MNTNRNQWRNRRNQLNSNPMPPFGTMQYSISNYSTDAVKSDFTKTFGDDMLIHNNSFRLMPNPLQKNLADTIVTAEKPVQAFTETKMEKEPIHSRSDYYPSFTGISSFFAGVFSVLSGGMFQRRAKSPAPQYYDCFDRADESPPLDWQAAKREDLNKSARAGEQSPVGERGAMSDCGAAVAQCEDKLNQIRLLLATKPTSTTPKFKRRPRKAFVEPGSVEESFEDAFSPEDFVRLANERYVECFSPYNHHKEELVEVEAPIIKTERVVVKIDIPTNKEADEVDAKLETKEIRVASVTEPKEDPEVEVIAVCEDKVNKLKELLQSRKPRRSIIEEKSTDSIAEPVLDKEDERASNRTKCIRIDKPQDKHSKKLRGSDKRKKSNMLKNIQDDMTFAHEIDADDVSSPDNSPLIKPTKLCNMISLCSKVAEVKPKLPEPEHKPDEYFDEVSGRFRSTSTTESEDSFQIVFTDSPKANRARKVSDCDSEDSFIVFEDSPDSCYTSHDVFGDQSDSEVTDDSDTESDVSDSGCGVSCKISGSFSRTVGDLTDDSLFDDTVRQGSDSEDEVDSAVRTMCEEIPEQDVEAEVTQKSTGLLIDDAKKLMRRHQPAKKVRFSEAPPRVLVMRVWAFAARAARAGHWERHALDRDRFKRKIADVDMAVSWVLKPQHRSRVMFQRFMPWWNAQRRKEIAEKKQRDEEEKIEKERAEEERKAKERDEDVRIEEGAQEERDEEDREAKMDKNLENESKVECNAPIECNGSVDNDLRSGLGGVLSLSKCDFYDRTDAIGSVEKVDSVNIHPGDT